MAETDLDVMHIVDETGAHGRISGTFRMEFAKSISNRSVKALRVSEHSKKPVVIDLSQDAGNVFEWLVYTTTQGSHPEPLIDISRQQTERLVLIHDRFGECYDISGYGLSGSGDTDVEFPLLLNEPSPHLKAAYIVGYKISQETLNWFAACPNLETLCLKDGWEGQPAELTLPAPANPRNVRHWAFDSMNITSAQDWEAPDLQLLCISHTKIAEIPPKLVSTSNFVPVLLLHNNLITDETAAALVQHTGIYNGAGLDLSDNLLTTIPPFLAARSDQLCFHSETATFGKGCLCTNYKYHQPSNWHDWHPYRTEWSNTDLEPNIAPNWSKTRNKVVIGGLDSVHGFYPHLHGIGGRGSYPPRRSYEFYHYTA